MSRDDRDPYSILGVRRQASASEISRAYRRAARETHPDNHPGDPTAAERFNAVSDAHDTLGDPQRRAAHDRAHPVGRPFAPRAGPQPARPGRTGGAPKVDVKVSVFGIPLAPLGRRRPAPRTRIEDELAQIAAVFSRLFRGAR